MTVFNISANRQIFGQVTQLLGKETKGSTFSKQESELLITHQLLMLNSPAYKAGFEYALQARQIKKNCPLTEKFYEATTNGNKLVSSICDIILYAQSYCNHFVAVARENSCGNRIRAGIIPTNRDSSLKIA